ncbi:LOW QUALITY PROTEIN: hypothetical protein U9M48_043981, partial [Paspalum notatum var. saurae]
KTVTDVIHQLSTSHRDVDLSTQLCSLTSICAYSGFPVAGTESLYDSSTPKLSCYMRESQESKETTPISIQQDAENNNAGEREHQQSKSKSKHDLVVGRGDGDADAGEQGRALVPLMTWSSSTTASIRWNASLRTPRASAYRLPSVDSLRSLATSSVRAPRLTDAGIGHRSTRPPAPAHGPAAASSTSTRSSSSGRLSADAISADHRLVQRPRCRTEQKWLVKKHGMCGGVETRGDDGE